MDNRQQGQVPQPAQHQLRNITAEQRPARMVQMQHQAFINAKNKDRQDRRTRIQEMLEPKNKGKPVSIDSFQEYVAMDAAYRSLRDKDGKDNKPSMDGFPKTTADQVARVEQLCAAILDFSDLLDRPNKKRSVEDLPMSNTAVAAVNALAPIEVQLLSWKILCATCDAHCGRHNIPTWTKVWRFKEYATFNLRFQDVIEALSRSKAMVKSILDSDVAFVKRIAAAPKDEFKLKRGNQEINDRRAANHEKTKKQKQKHDICEDANVAPE